MGKRGIARSFRALDDALELGAGSGRELVLYGCKQHHTVPPGRLDENHDVHCVVRYRRLCHCEHGHSGIPAKDDGGIATSASLCGSEQFALASDGNLYAIAGASIKQIVADSSTGTIFVVNRTSDNTNYSCVIALSAVRARYP